MASTYAVSLMALIGRTVDVIEALRLARSDARRAETIVPDVLKTDFRRWSDEISAIEKLVDEMRLEVAQRLAQDEAGSLG